MAQYTVTEAIDTLTAKGISIEAIAKKFRTLQRENCMGADFHAIGSYTPGDWYVTNRGDYDNLIDAARANVAQDAEVSPAAAALATSKQADYIMSLLAASTRSGEEGGFMTGPTTYSEVAKMTRTAASAYISSLKGTY